MTAWMERLVGPRLSAEDLERRRARFVVPSLLLAAAAVLLLTSVFLPYWHMLLKAPQYPGGLRVEAFLNRLEGDVREIKILAPKRTAF